MASTRACPPVSVSNALASRSAAETPSRSRYDLNGDIGGPIVKQKAWFFVSWRLNDKYAYITGLGNEVERSKLSNKYTLKGTFQVGRNNQIIGYLNKREKLQDKRGINLNTPLSAAYYQSSRNYPRKMEWTSVLGSRAFLDVLYGNWYNFFPLRPVRDYGLYDGPWTPPRQDTSSAIWSNTGGNNGYQDQKRYKPQFYTTLSYFKDGWKGSHDLRTGFDWKRDRRSLFNDQPFDIWYRDSTVGGVANTLTQVDIYNSSVTGINDVVYTAGWINDTWKVSNRLTLNLGVRVENYQDEWPDQTHTPNGIPALAGWTDPRYTSFVAPKDVKATTVANTTTLAPKFGFAYDLSGDNRTVIKGFIGQSRWNSADTLADQENPVGLAQLRYAFVSCARRPDHRLRPERRSPRQLARRARRVPVHAGRRRLRARRPRSRAADQQRSVGQPRARAQHGPVGPRVMGLQEHAQRVG